MASPCKRRDTDLMKLMMSDFKVETINDSTHEFYVELNGPPDSLYQGGVWKVRVELPLGYPYSSPSIGFVNKIYHPNIDEESGSVCVDVLNQTWTPIYDLVNVFGTFLPQLLLDPNPKDPLNAEAGALMMHNMDAYDQKVKAYPLEICSTIFADSLMYFCSLPEIFVHRIQRFLRERSEYCIRYAKAEDLGGRQEEEDGDDISDDESASSDEETAGPASP